MSMWQPVGGRHFPANSIRLDCPTLANSPIEIIRNNPATPNPAQTKENAATSGKVTASGNLKAANLHCKECHKRRARATGLFVWDRRSGSIQTLAGMQAVLA